MGGFLYSILGTIANPVIRIKIWIYNGKNFLREQKDEISHDYN